MTNDNREKIRNALESNPDFEIISENPDFIEFFDNDAELPFRARLSGPSPEYYDAMLRVLPQAEGLVPPRKAVLDFLMSLDPAMTAGLSGIYVRAGEGDDREIWEMDGGWPAEEGILHWNDDYGDRCGWYWRDRGSVVVNARCIASDAESLAGVIYPESGMAPMRKNEAGKISFEQFFITLAHEIRHLAIEFPLTDLYCEIYPDAERDGKTCIEDFRDGRGMDSGEALEEDAESWARDAFDSWRGLSPFRKPAKRGLKP